MSGGGDGSGAVDLIDPKLIALLASVRSFLADASRRIESCETGSEKKKELLGKFKKYVDGCRRLREFVGEADAIAWRLATFASLLNYFSVENHRLSKLGKLGRPGELVDLLLPEFNLLLSQALQDSAVRGAVLQRVFRKVDSNRDPADCLADLVLSPGLSYMVEDYPELEPLRHLETILRYLRDRYDDGHKRISAADALEVVRRDIAECNPDVGYTADQRRRHAELLAFCKVVEAQVNKVSPSAREDADSALRSFSDAFGSSAVGGAGDSSTAAAATSGGGGGGASADGKALC